jgi:GTPase
MFVDSVTLQIKAGDGGNGAATFLRNGLTAKGGPDGGNGGNGGNIYFQGSNNIRDLKEFRFKKKIRAEDGTPGRNQKMFGKNADHTTILVPLGTQITEVATGRIYEITDTESPYLIALGGLGGRGNAEFKSATNQAPTFAEKGTKGEEKTLHLELRLIADIGLIGLPNAGKSSLLSVLTHANPKVGDYPFTTLEPNIGMLDHFAIADIPGLIEGASHGKGLGIAFLKHIEKTKIIVHCIDVTDENSLKTYEVVRKEFQQYNELLLEKPEIILFTKTDLVGPDVVTSRIKLFKKTHKYIFAVSVFDEKSVAQLKDALMKIVV